MTAQTFIASLLLMITGAGQTAPAQESPDNDGRPILYRKIYVPKALISKFKDVYYPVGREEFQRAVDTIRSRHATPGARIRTGITEGKYSAKLDGDQLVGGMAELSILHEVDVPAAVPLEPCNLAIGEPVWHPVGADDSADDTTSPAHEVKVGLDDAGKTVAVVDTFGILQFSWSLRGRRESSGRLVFDVRLPPSPVNQLELAIPHGLKPTFPNGFVSKVVDSESDGTHDKWSIKFRGDSSGSLYIAPEDAMQKMQQLVLLRQHATYRFSTKGIDVSVDLHLDIHNEALGQLSILLDQPLQLVDAVCGETQLSWTEAETPDGREVVLEFSEPISGIGRHVQLHAMAGPATGTRQRLPGLYPHEEDVLWLEGKVDLEVPRPLSLEYLTADGGRQSSVSPLAGPEEGERVQIQFFRPNANVHVTIGRRDGEIIVHQGTTIRLGSGATSAVQVADFKSTGSQRFLLEMETSAIWTIDLVETVPPDLIDEWLPVKEGSQRLVQVRLREALSPTQELRVIVHGQGRAIRDAMRLDGRELRLGVFRNVSIARSLIAVGADAPKQVRLGGDAELTRLETSQLTEKEAGLLTPLAGGAIYVDGREADDLTVAASSDPPNYAAELYIESDVREDTVEHAFHIRCIPESSSVAELLVHFSESSDGEILWEFTDQSDVAPVARRLTTEGQPSEGTRRGETWRVSLPQQQDARFELVARGTAPFDKESSIPLVSLPGAASQIGKLVIRSSETVPITIRQQKVTAVPPEPLSPGRYATTRGVFRYEPSEESRASVVRRDRDTRQALAWIWSCHLTSRFCPDGVAVHEAVYRIENAGSSQFEITPPHDSEVTEASVDGRKVPPPIETSQNPKLIIPLPRGVRFPTAVVQFATQGESLGPLATVAARWPQPDLPVFRREWIVWLPPGHDRLGPDGGQSGVGWHRRLFGPLLRSERRSRFNLFSRDHWQSLGAEVNAQQTNRMREQADAFLQGLVQEVHSLPTGSEEASSSVTWGELLRSCVGKLKELEHAAIPDVLVDGNALAQIGITARTTVDRSIFAIQQPQSADATARGSARRGARLLESAGLALVSHEGRLLLTTAEDLACSNQQSWQNTARSVAVGIDSAGWDRFARDGTEPRVVPLAAWAAKPYLPQSCWSIPPRRPYASVENDGWTAHVVPMSSGGNGETGADEVMSLRVRQPQTMQAFGWAAFLVSVGLVLWIVRRRVLLGIPLIAVAGSIALLVPDGFAPIFTGCFLGALLAVSMVFVWPARTRVIPQPAQTDGSSSSIARAELTGLILAAAILWMNASNACAQETRAAEPSSTDRPKIYRVLCPVDENRKPSGDHLFVPPTLFDALLGEPSTTDMGFGKWKIYAADYRAILHWDVTEDELSATELVATYQFDVFQPGTKVLLPLDQQKVYLLSGRARLDENEASVSWEPEGLSIEVEAAGPCKLELALRPIIERTEEKAGFDIEIPPVLRSRLTLAVPDEANDIEFPTAIGAVEHSQDGQHVVDLGPTNRLNVQWPVDPEASAFPSKVAVDQLMWLKVRASSVVLDARFKFSTLAGRIERMQLLADPRLRILPPDDDQPIAGYHVRADDVQTILLDAEPPFQQELTFDVRFVLTETASIGNVRLPRLEAVADRTNRRWLGVSVAPDLEFDQPENTVEDPPTAADFAAAWGQVDELPLVVTRVPDGETDWSLATRPREPKITAAQRLIVSLTQERADFRFDADIEISDGSRVQYKISVPKSFEKTVEVTSVSVMEDDAERLARWSRDVQGNVIVRLDGPVSQPHRLQVHGKMTVPRFRRSKATSPKTLVRIPRITLDDATLSSDRVELYRRPKVKVAVSNKTGFVDATDIESGGYTKDLGRLVAALDALPGGPRSAAVQVNLSPNRPRTIASIVTTLDRHEDAWRADADCQLNVRNGIVDMLRLEIPPEWIGPFDLDAEAQVETIKVPGQNRRYLVLRPSHAIEGPYRIRIRGTLSATGERIRAPEITLLDVDRADRYLIAPTRIQNRQIAWETSGLQARTLPPGFGEPDLESYVSYRAGPSRFQAVIKDVQPKSGVPRVALADIHVDFDRDGSVLGVATFDLEPAGLSDCKLELPAGYKPVHVTVANLPAEPERMEDGGWRVPLGPRQLPQQIQVLFGGRLEPGLLVHGPAVLRAPSLADVTVGQTLWTVQGPSPGSLELVDVAGELDPLAHELLRMEQNAALVEDALDGLAESDTADIVQWYVPWARRCAASHARAIRWQAASASDERSVALDVINAQQREIAQRLDPDELKSHSASESWQAVELVDVWRIASDRSRTAGRGTFSGMRDRIEVHHRFEVNDTTIERLAAVTVLVGIVVIAFLLLPHPAFANGIGRYPQLLGIPLGIAWWLWLAPSFLGWIIVLMSALGLIPAAFRRDGNRRLVADNAAAE